MVFLIPSCLVKCRFMVGLLIIIRNIVDRKIKRWLLFVMMGLLRLICLGLEQCLAFSLGVSFLKQQMAVFGRSDVSIFYRSLKLECRSADRFIIHLLLVLVALRLVYQGRIGCRPNCPSNLTLVTKGTSPAVRWALGWSCFLKRLAQCCHSESFKLYRVEFERRQLEKGDCVRSVDDTTCRNRMDG